MRLITLLFLISSVGHAAPDIRAFWWSEGRDEKTSEKLVAFYLAPAAVMRFYEALAKGDEKEAERIAASLPKNAWSYIIGVVGESDVVGTDKLVLREGTICGDFPKLESGTVILDRKTRALQIALKVVRDGKAVDFEGNGVYTVTQAPNKAPEPTTTSVTAPAAQEPRQP